MQGSALARPVALGWLRPTTGRVVARAPVDVAARALALVVVWAAFATRLIRLGEQNIWWDEGLAFWAVSKGWWETTLWTAGDVHPPVFFWLLWAQVRLAGDTEFAARFVPVACGVLTVAAVVPLGRLLGGRRAGWWVGLIAAALLAVGRFPVWWSQELRMYAPAALFVALATIFAVRALLRGDRWQVGYLIAASLCLWTLYLTAPALLALNAVVAVTVAARFARGQRPWALLRDWTIVQCLVVGAYAPWLVVSAERMRTRSTAEPVTVDVFARVAAVVITTGVSTDIEALWPTVAAAIIGVSFLTVVALVARWPGGATLPGWIAVAATVAVVLVFIFAATQPRSLFYSPRLEARYFLIAAPLVAVMVAGALVAIGRVVWPVAAGLTIGALAVSSATTYAYLDARHVRDEYGSIVQTLDAYAHPSDAVVLVSGDRSVVFQYWYQRGV
ncbi:MAG: glycosyltransferase family 39 protein, partial [Dehalococcoidia bacterium]|nr:glycosyltransferase family 39 protein [Dehalococcoidia bacterium]